ncbi:type I restriction-modification system subunit M [Microbacterium memoriense]|uniref:site-specific DNA-methyltransferase (adenine-specific) n=1 Tax=Microbacterium memoriense TaxID=2978350 RepID=A0ABT2PB16_9MICO|nr:class I SAM-dependent DNA methyltransferase [Microbacterium memoriense]MCT9001223.1 type I restriction-modification system subunit M [Microbacterium memoriense]
MVTGELRPQVDKVWDAFWSGGIANPVEVIEQITYLLFIRRLDELHTLAEKKAARTGQPIENPVFPEGLDDTARTPRPYNDLRWSVFTNYSPSEMFDVVAEYVFPFLRRLGAEGSSYARNMKDARFTIPTPALLTKVVDLLADIPMDDRDTKGDIYEYMLKKLATSGTNGQFRTARHVIQLMVDLTEPRIDDRIIDPAVGTAGFLVAAEEYLRDHHEDAWTDATFRAHFNNEMFTGYDSDAAMARIASMNMLLHGVENPTIERADSLSEGHPSEGVYSLVLANPPFAGSLDDETVAKDLQKAVKTRKTELLFLVLMIKLLKNGGRAAVIVPEGVLFGSSNAHKAVRKMLVEDQKLDAVIKLPSGTFKPYTGVSTAILLFTKTSSGGTDKVWFYDVRADGFTLDDKRTPIDATDYPDIVARWRSVTAGGSADAHTLAGGGAADAHPFADRVAADGGVPRSPEHTRPRTAQSFLVPKQEIVDNAYDLSLNRYKELEIEEVEHRSPTEILNELDALEVEIQAGLARLREMLA